MKTILSLIVVLFITSNTLFAQTKKGSARYEFGSTLYPGVDSGEVFIENISTTSFPIYDEATGFTVYWSDEQFAVFINFRNIPWTTKRLGEIAYTSKGVALPNQRPVFVKKSELIKAGVVKK